MKLLAPSDYPAPHFRPCRPLCELAGWLTARICLAIVCSMAPQAYAAELVVTNDQPTGSGSLDEAVQLANATQGPDTISFDAGFFATSRSIEADRLAITDAVTIRGPGKALLTIQGVPSTTGYAGKLSLSGPESSNELTTVVENLTVRTSDNGHNTSLLHAVNHNLTLRNVHLAGNGKFIYGAGGAVTIRNAELVLEDVLVDGFNSGLSGGAITMVTNDTLHPSVTSLARIQRTAFRDNHSDANGGALSIRSFNETGSVAVVIRDSEFSNNSARVRGGALDVQGAFNISIANSTFSGNTAESNFGGAIDAVNYSVTSASLTINASTFTNNLAGDRGGAISSIGDHAPSIRVANSVIAGNTVVNTSNGRSQDVYSDSSFVTSHSLIGDRAGANPSLVIEEHQSTPGSTLIDTDPMLAALADNGGATRTHAIRSGSPLLDAGNMNAPTRDPALPQPATDQRGAGYPRVSSAAADIGAYEFQVSGGGNGGTSGSGGGGAVGDWSFGLLVVLAALRGWRSARVRPRT